MGEARTVGVGMNNSPASISALRWTVKNLLDDGDTLILIHVLPKNAEHTGKIFSKDSTGSELIPLEELKELNNSKKYGLAYDDKVLDLLDTLAKAKKSSKELESSLCKFHRRLECMQVTVVAKVYLGDPKEKLCDAVESLKLDSIVLGSRGLGWVKRMLLGSVSSHVVTNVACPVTVVKDN